MHARTLGSFLTTDNMDNSKIIKKMNEKKSYLLLIDFIKINNMFLIKPLNIYYIWLFNKGNIYIYKFCNEIIILFKKKIYKF